MSVLQPFKPETLNDNGLNLQFVCNIDALPTHLIEHLEKHIEALDHYRQLILIGHGGKQLWKSLTGSASKNENPIDNFTLDVVNTWLNTSHTSTYSHVIYPDSQSIDLIALGALAGWHHESPFKVGINSIWGPWFAYRAVILADSHFAITPPFTAPSPCSACQDKPCIKSCPAEACNEERMDINKCIRYRKTHNSKCAKTCLARISCPVQPQHRYAEAQMDFHYTESMKIINQYDL